MILFFDTETTGLPKNWKAPVSDLNNWPRMVQLAWILYENDGNKLKEGNYIIKPVGFSIPPDAAKVHGITNVIALSKGTDLKTVLNNFAFDVEQAEYIVAHNISFDVNIAGAEFLRNSMTNILSGKKKICTMESTTNFCAIAGPYGYKCPSLSELHYKLFKENFIDAHDAKIDIDITAKCFWELKRRGFFSSISKDNNNLPEKYDSGGSLERVGKLIDIGNKLLVTENLNYELVFLKENANIISSVCFSKNRNAILFVSGDNTIKLWDIYRNEIKIFKGHTDKIKDICLSSDEKYIGSCSNDWTIRLWDVETSKELKIISIDRHREAYKIKISSDNKYIIVLRGHEGDFAFGEILVFNINTGKREREFPICLYWSVKFSPDGNYFIYENPPNCITLTNILTGKGEKIFNEQNKRREDSRLSMFFSHNGKNVISKHYYPNEIKIWDIETGKEIRTFTDSYKMYGICFSTDDNIIGFLTADGNIKLLNKISDYIKSFNEKANSILFMPDKKNILLCCSDCTMKILNIESGKVIIKLYSIDENDWLVTTPDGRFDASEGAMKYINYVKGLEIYPLEKFKDKFYSPGLLSKILK